MHTHRRRQIAASLLIALLLLLLAPLTARSAALGGLTVTFLDVGQGDSILLRDASGFDVLIDGGQPEAGPTVVAYLRQKGVDSIDVLVASHPDSDHIGGLITVLKATDIPILALIYNGYPGSSDTWDHFLTAASARGLTPTAAQFPGDFTWGEMTAHVLNPDPGLENPDTNDASLVLRVDHGEVNFLFTGDISSAVEDNVTAHGTPAASEVLKVAHHGSGSSSSASFLDSVDPRDSVIEVGIGNEYGHPDADTIQRLISSGSKIWETDKNGSIQVVSDGITYRISGITPPRRIYLPQIIGQGPRPNPGGVSILSISADGAGTAEPDEYVAIKNSANQAVDLRGWTLRDSGDHIYTFPAYNIQPGQVCRVYTNQSDPESCGFNYGSGTAIWNNGGDCAYLRDGQGKEISKMCY